MILAGFFFTIIIIENIIIIVTIKWKMVKDSPKIRNAKNATKIGIGETRTLTLLISICDKLLYQNKTSKPYKNPISKKNKILIGSNRRLIFVNG